MHDDGQAQDMDMDNQAEGEQDKDDVMTPADILYGKDEDIVESVTDKSGERWTAGQISVVFWA